MKTTGIVRRVDDLGRIVIPREYRRAYDIDIGDPMEISADESGTITLKRVDVGADFKRAAQTCTAFLSDRFGWTTLACDGRRIICGSGKKHAVFEGRDLPIGVAEIMKNYRFSRFSPRDNFPEFAEEFPCGALCPVIGQRGVDGAIMALGESEFSDNETRMIELCAKLIASSVQKY